MLTEEFARQNPDLVRGFAKASLNVKDVLQSDDAAWNDIREMINAANDAQYEALREGWRAGIPSGKAVDKKAAAKMFEIMRELGGAQLVGDATQMPEGVFLDLSF